MTKEEIQKMAHDYSESLKLTNWTSLGDVFLQAGLGYMEGYNAALKEIEGLKAELNELKNKLEIQENYNDMLVYELRERDKELSELKERHKKDVCGFADFLKDYEYVMSLGLKYGAYVNKNEVDIYVNGSELHYQILVLNDGKSIEQLYEQYYKQKFKK